jgi:hypothetical protein
MGAGHTVVGGFAVDCNLPVQSNSIGHARVPCARPVIPDFHGPRVVRADLDGATISFLEWDDQCRGCRPSMSLPDVD